VPARSFAIQHDGLPSRGHGDFAHNLELSFYATAQPKRAKRHYLRPVVDYAKDGAPNSAVCPTPDAADVATLHDYPRGGVIMRQSTSSLQQTTIVSESRTNGASAVDRLNILLSDSDDAIRSLNLSWQALMRQLASIEKSIEHTDWQARRLDAFVDDALYSGDAGTARCCADRAKALRLELARITEQFNSNKRLARLLQENIARAADGRKQAAG
jgi:hypothetical protein